MSKERLVELMSTIPCDNKKCGYECNGECVGEFDWSCQKKALAEHLLANGVIVPPLKMGDKVWIIDWCYEINAYEVSNIRFKKNSQNERYSYDAKMVGKAGAVIGFDDSDIGEFVFLTREEAENKLEEGKNNVKP